VTYIPREWGEYKGGSQQSGLAFQDSAGTLRFFTNIRVEALAARVLKKSKPELAIRSLKTAVQDWNYVVEGMKTAEPLPEIYGRPDGLERISLGAIASVDLYRATGEQKYADEAFRLGALILASQEQKIQPWSIPMTGYFYTGPKRENLFHRFHIGQEQEPVIALAHLCETFPGNANWMKCYSAIVLHSKYYQQVAAKVDQPFNVLPAAVNKESEARLIPEGKDWTPLRAADRDSYVQQVYRGVPLGGEYYLRRFPVWFDFRGNSSVLLSEEKRFRRRTNTRRRRGARSGATTGAMAAGTKPFFGQRYVWGRL
jgi:hypothetical protein